MNLEKYDLTQVVSTAVSATFEGMAFTDAEPLGEGSFPPAGSEVFLAGLDVIKPAGGRVSIVLPVRLAREIADNIYSINENAPTEEMITDTVAELLNTLAGLIVGAVAPDTAAFALGLPETSRIDRWQGAVVSGQGSGIAQKGPETGKTFFFTVSGETLSVIVEGDILSARDGRD